MIIAGSKHHRILRFALHLAVSAFNFHVKCLSLEEGNDVVINSDNTWYTITKKFAWSRKLAC